MPVSEIATFWDADILWFGQVGKKYRLLLSIHHVQRIKNRCDMFSIY
jgi:hypothetical protein